MKLRLAGLTAVLCVLLPAPKAGAAEHLVMPYTCKVDRGRVVLSPSSPRSYPVQGLRAQRPFTWCPPNGGPCRVRMVHRFEINCAGGRMSWLVVAAAAARARAQTLSIVGGRLRMALTSTGDLAEACDLRLGPGADRDCRSRPSGRPGVVIASLPPGFAPLHEVGARIALHPLPAQKAEATAGSPPERSLQTGGITQTQGDPVTAGEAVLRQTPPPSPVPASRDDIAVVLASDERTPDDQEAPPAVSATQTFQPVAMTGWTASVIDNAEAAVAEAHGTRDHTRSGPLILVLLLGSVVIGAGLQHRHRLLSQSSPADGAGGRGIVRRAAGALALDQDERACLELGRTVEQLMKNADARLDELTAAAPLRGVLRQELDLIKLRLAEGLKLADQPKPKWRQLRTRLQGAIRELHRIVKIAEGAIASFASNGAGRELPRSREEAYDALGVNSDVSESVLKKVVDALRMSWHPDLAKDEPDRQRREERTKIINVAWDLVTGRRVEMH